MSDTRGIVLLIGVFASGLFAGFVIGLSSGRLNRGPGPGLMEAAGDEKGMQALAELGQGDETAKSGNLYGAVYCYRRALSTRPLFPEAHYKIGQVMEQMRRIEDAADAYKKALELRPQYSEAMFRLALCYRQLADYGEAAVSFRRAIRLDNEYVPAYTELGKTYIQMKELTLAREAVLKAALLQMHLTGNDDETRRILGLLSETDPNEDKAPVAAALPRIEGFEVDGATYYRVGVLLGEAERYELAVCAYTEAMRKKGEGTPSHFFYNRGCAYRRMGKPEKAIDDFQHAIRIGIGDEFPPVYKELAEVQLALGKNEEASGSFYRAGTLFLKANQTNEAIFCFMNAKRLSPEVDLSLLKGLGQGG